MLPNTDMKMGKSIDICLFVKNNKTKQNKNLSKNCRASHRKVCVCVFTGDSPEFYQSYRGSKGGGHVVWQGTENKVKGVRVYRHG